MTHRNTDVPSAKSQLTPAQVVDCSSPADTLASAIAVATLIIFVVLVIGPTLNRWGAVQWLVS